jgi:hypothetical protein
MPYYRAGLSIRKLSIQVLEEELGLSTVSIYTDIQAAVIWVPYPSHLAFKNHFDRTVDGPVTPHIRPSGDGCIWAV